MPLFLLLAVALAQPAVARAAGSQTAPGPLAALERALFDAIHRRDADALDRLLAEDFVMRASPNIGRRQWLENALTLCWGDRSDIDQLAAERRGAVAVVSFVVTMYENPDTCEDAVIRSLVTDVWEEGPGGWRLLVRHSGPVGAADDVGRQFEEMPLPPPRWEIRAEFSLVSTGGNAETQTVGTGADVVYRPGLWETAIRSAFVRSQGEDVVNARSLSLELRQARQLSDRLELFGRASFLQDRFAGIDPRLSTDGGVAYRIVSAPPHTLKLDAGLGVARETRLAGGDLTFGLASLVGRYAFDLTDASQMTNETGFTADLTDGDNWRLNNTAALTAALTQLVSVKLSYTVKFLNLPVPGFERTDTIASAALVTTFARR